MWTYGRVHRVSQDNHPDGAFNKQCNKIRDVKPTNLKTEQNQSTNRTEVKCINMTH